jgi:hypothetical protein
MSMPVAYEPPDYTPQPPLEEPAWRGFDRRSQDPIDRLGRAFNRLCLEATDRFEILAHLEALGYNDPAALESLGVDDRFELARRLYERTPTSFALRPPDRHQDRDRVGPAAMALTLGVTLVLGAYASTALIAPALWVLVWSQLGAAVLARADAIFERPVRARVLAALLQLGMVGLGVTWLATPFGPAAAAPALLWFAVASTLWSGRRFAALALPLLVAVALAATRASDAPLTLAQAATSLLSLGFVLPLAMRAWHREAGWLAHVVRHAGYPALYGVGQAMLILALLRQSPPDLLLVPGAILLAAILLTSRSWLVRLKEQLTEQLWASSHVRVFAASVRRYVLGYATLYLVPIAGVAVIDLGSGPLPWAFHVYAFGAFGLCLALAVVMLALGDPATPAIAFALAGALALTISYGVACAALAALQLGVLLRRSGRVERYALHLL